MKSKKSASRMRLPLELPSQSASLQSDADKHPTRGRRIPHRKILKALADSQGSADLVLLYRERVLPVKTRNISLLGRKSHARIIHTLLGYEVQASYKRIDCPDLVTARYLKIFSDLGCHSIRLPYDPTVTAAWILDFEAAVDRITAEVNGLFPTSESTRLYVLRRLCEIIRLQLLAG